MPAGPTYEPIATYTVTGSDTSSVSFTSIPSTYTDLVLITNLQASVSVNSDRMRFNNDSSTNYDFVTVYGNNGNNYVKTAVASSQTNSVLCYNIVPTEHDISFVGVLNIFNYANTNVFKTHIFKCGNGRTNGDTSEYTGAEMGHGIWKSTSAINRIDLIRYGGNYKVDSTFTLYGIKAA